MPDIAAPGTDRTLSARMGESRVDYHGGSSPIDALAIVAIVIALAMLTMVAVRERRRGDE